MRNQWKETGNYLLYALLLILLIGMQSSFWNLALIGLPAPQAWLSVLAFWTVYRDVKEGLVMSYIVFFLVGSATSLPLGLLMLCIVALFVIGTLFKARVFWPGSSYFAVVTAAGTFLFPFIHLIASHMFESNPIHEFRIFTWFFSALFNGLLAFPLFLLYTWIDKFTEKELPADTGQV